MKAMILAAGKGKRMRPLSNEIPKPLLLVKGKPLIEYHILALAKVGVTDIVINLNHLGDKIKNYLGDGEKYGVRICYSIENTLLNTGGGIVNAIQYLGEDPFIVLSADIHTNYCFSKLINKKIEGLAHLVLVQNPEFNKEGDFSLDDNLVKPKSNNTYTYANIGIYKAELFANKYQKKKFINVIESEEKDKEKDKEKDNLKGNAYKTKINELSSQVFPLSDVLLPAINKNLVTGELFTGDWFNVGTKEQLQYVNSL